AIRPEMRCPCHGASGRCGTDDLSLLGKRSIKLHPDFQANAAVPIDGDAATGSRLLRTHCIPNQPTALRHDARKLGGARLSALPPKADIDPHGCDVCSIADIMASDRKSRKRGGECRPIQLSRLFGAIGDQPPPPPICSLSIWSFSNGTGFSGCCKSGIRSVEAPPTYRVMFGYFMIDLSKSIMTG